MYDIAEATLSQYLQNGEGETVEFKEILPNKETLAKIFSAFANNMGGTLLVGISDCGDVIGASLNDSINRLIVDVASNNCEPPIRVKVSKLHDEVKEIIAIHIPKGKRLHSVRGRCFLRVGSTIRRLTMDEIQRAMFEKGMLEFDKMPVNNATFDDVDEEKVKWFLRKAQAERNYNVDPKTHFKEVMERLHLIENGKLTSTAILMFGKDPQRFFLQSRIKCGRLKGTDGLDFLDMKVIKGTIPELRNGAMKFITNHARHGIYFDDNQRHDRWEYPLRALEEVLNNALAHRDYSSNADIQVSIYDDRIEVWNPGELLEPLTPADLKKKHNSIPRNKLLAGTMFLIKYIEEWGTGTNRVMKKMKKYHLPEPEFQNISGGFEVLLTGPGESFKDKIGSDDLPILDINERQRKALEYLHEKGRITRSEYCKLTNLKATQAKKEINILIRKKIIKRIGKGRATYYTLATD